ncbi:MAG: alpha/beta fold hydrolase, partial [Deltaproteobacteria bacterium]|nr:alpha/beta fold hydrolase [Deltaproteobacteria bacterium]
LKPVDRVVESGLDLLRAANLYDPFRRGLKAAMLHAMRTNFRLTNDLSVYGAENVPLTGGMVLACNHQSWLDVQVLSVACPRPLSFLAKSEFEDWPFLRHLIAMTDSVFIRRTGDDSGLMEVAEKLRGGMAIGIFPEGTIPGEEDVPRWDVDPETGLLRGKSGVVRLALAGGVPIVPVGVSGTGRAFPPEAYPRMQKWPPLPGPGRIEVRFGEPIHLTPREGIEPAYDELRGMTDRVMRSISHLVDHGMNFEPMSLPLRRKEFPTDLPRIAYRSAPRPAAAGKAPLGVLVLHGFTSHVDCVADLREDLDALAVPYRMPWLRGHGTRWEDLRGVTWEDWFADAEETLLDLLQEARRVVVVGLSMGGLVALDLAARYRREVAGVVPVAAALAFKDPLAGLTGAISRVVPSWPSPNSYSDPELKKLRNRNYPKFPTDAFASLYAYTGVVKNRLSFVAAPCHVVAARKDSIVAPAAAETILAKVGSRRKDLVWFEESGHEMLLDLEAAKVRANIRGFIETLIREHDARVDAASDRATTGTETAARTPRRSRGRPRPAAK